VTDTDLAGAIAKQQATDSVVLDAGRSPDFDIAHFESAWAAFEQARV